MNIAEFFVKLGVKGEDSTGKALKNVKSDMVDLSAKGLAVKGAIIGAVYGLQQMMSKSSQAGDGMYKFAKGTELSTTLLQKWQNAGRKAGVEVGEIESSIRSVQDSIANMKLGGGAPEGFGMLTALTDFDPLKMDDTFYMLKKIQELAQTMDAPTAKKFVTSFGVGDEMFRAMRENMFSPKNMNSFDIYTDKQIESFHKMQKAWDEMYHRMEIMTGKFFADDGLKLIGPIGDVADSIGGLIKKFTELGNSSVILSDLGKLLRTMADAIREITDLVDKYNKSSYGTRLKENVSNIKDWALYANDMASKAMWEGGKKLFGALSGAQKSMNSTRSNVSNTNVTNNNSIKIDGSQDPRAVAEEIKKVINKSYREKTGGLSE